VRALCELERVGSIPTLKIGAWEERFSGVVAGITCASPRTDFGLTTSRSAWTLLEQYERLAAQLGFRSVVTVRQIHGNRVMCVRTCADGWRSLGPADGLLCASDGVLLAVTAADCVPIYLLHPDSRLVGLLHAGWRGIAAGVLRAGIERAAHRFRVPAGELHLHFGPAICGACYEVGPDVVAALEITSNPSSARSRKVDLRALLGERAERLGVKAVRISRSEWCTQCSAGRLYSHRGSGGNAGRMAAFLGWRRP